MTRSPSASVLALLTLILVLPTPASSKDPTPASSARPRLTDYFPSSEEEGGWRTLLPESGSPGAKQKEKIRTLTGVDWDKLAAAWKFNASAQGATGFVVIRRGHIVGEWYRGCERTTAFNIYSSSKAYTSVAYG